MMVIPKPLHHILLYTIYQTYIRVDLVHSVHIYQLDLHLYIPVIDLHLYKSVIDLHLYKPVID